jgi:hypothetical protein
MDYLLIALGAFALGALVQRFARQGRARRNERRQRRDATSRQADAFLRGIRAFEQGVATQIERDRRAARLRRLMGRPTRTL